MISTIRFSTIQVLLTAVLFVFPVFAATDSSPSVIELNAKPIHVSMFKNGIGMITAQVELPEQSGTIRVRPLPEARLGSLWLQWPNHVTLSDIKATQTETQTLVPAQTIKEILEANIGEVLDVQIRDQWHRVTILDIPYRHEDPILQSRLEESIPPPTPPERGEILILEDSLGKRALPVNWVHEIRFPSQNVRCEVKRSTRENGIECKVTLPENSSKLSEKPVLTISYLAKGIAWSPSYIVDISKEEKAMMTAKTIVINDLLALHNTDAELITGYPHIAYADQTDAFSLTPLDQILEQIRRGSMDRSRRSERNVLSQQMILSNVAANFEMPMDETPIAGGSTEDLYFYPVQDITLKKGERGYYPLFSAEIPYEHIYTWDIPDYIDTGNRYRSEQTEEPQIVWHSLKLTNSTSLPWTTSTAMTMKDGRILGQDTIKYTPPNTASELKITQALSIKAEQNEEEIDRKRNAMNINNVLYDLVKIRGELVVSNFKDEPVNVKITKMISGEMMEADRNPQVIKTAIRIKMLNPQSQLIWNIPVEPGKEKKVKLTYLYQVYVRN